MMRLIRVAVATTLILFGAFASYGSDFNLHLEIRSLREAGAPRIFEDYVLFTHQLDGPVRFVGASFAHEDYLVLHDFVRNEHGVFILPFPIPDGVEELRYRLIVDGLWMADPRNPRSVRNSSGVGLSLFGLPEEVHIDQSPVVNENGTVTFLLTGREGNDVFISASFNNWDPFMHRMDEIEPGRYELTLRVGVGRHYYFFVENGDRILDPLNRERVWNRNGHRVSVVDVSREFSFR